ncbi:MAG: flagellar hook-length control protein FliK [Propionivibrio sp.]|nr:flagellar hook-length control protein FliK [Propionivibrio sp.]MBP6710361.1 flagellar hook-length control protein FliK [Propionivibrio sp.]MBP7525089.1 flagellar hook-length control protein FliK [Propionivibrio sp.]MBP8163015.1 flagellar hook-length control protein FliK [Propionivibrio sp.]
MSVTIVSALPPSHSAPPSNGTESTMASEGGAIGLDFANILFSQKLMNLSVNTGEAGLQEETGDGLAQTEAAEVDTASILATLGLVTQQSAQSADQPAPAPVGSAKSETTAGLAQVGTGIDAEKPIKADTTPLAATADGADGPAKFAVATVATTEKAPATESIAKGDEQARTISTLASHPAATAQRDAPLAVHANIRDQSWSSEFSQKIVWLATADKQSAQLTLNPPQMGPIEISLSVDKGSASASFVSANQEVRDAIETALPRLREMFASAGIQLGQTNVSSESFRQQSENPAASRARSQAGGDNDILAGGSVESLTSRGFHGQAGNGLVDLFA